MADESESPTRSWKPPLDVTVMFATVGAVVAPSATVTVGAVIVKAGVVVVMEAVLEMDCLYPVFPS